MSGTIILRGSANGQISIRSAANVTPNLTLVLPAADGTAGQVLTTDGAGNLSFASNDTTVSLDRTNAVFALSNTLFDGTAAADVANLTSSGPITAQYITLDNSGYYGDVGFSGGGMAITANDTFAIQTNLAVDGEGGPLWEFGADGNLTIPGSISGANVITANTIIASNASIVQDLTVGNRLTVANVSIAWHAAPTTSKGSVGDKAGFCAIDNDKIYRCIADYTDGNADIWVYVNFTGGTWG